MIHFFRDVLDGPIYLIVVVVSIVLILAIVGFILEKKKAEKEEQDKRVTISNATPVEPIRTREVVLSTKEDNHQIVNSEINLNQEQPITIDSSTVNVEETALDNQKEATKVEDIVPVIDFGTIQDIELNDQVTTEPIDIDEVMAVTDSIPSVKVEESIIDTPENVITSDLNIEEVKESISNEQVNEDLEKTQIFTDLTTPVGSSVPETNEENKVENVVETTDLNIEEIKENNNSDDEVDEILGETQQIPTPIKSLEKETSVNTNDDIEEILGETQEITQPITDSMKEINTTVDSSSVNTEEPVVDPQKEIKDEDIVRIVSQKMLEDSQIETL